MLYFKPRRRIFAKRGLRLRHVATAAILAGAVMTTAMFFSQPSEPVSYADAVVATADSFTPPAPNTIAPGHDDAAVSMKSGFDQAPVEPSYDYAAAKPQEKTLLSKKIASIQSGISTFLQAGSDLLVSQKKLFVGKGDTLMDILIRNNVPRGEAHDAIAALSKVYDPRDLNVGHAITVFFHKDPQLNDIAFSGLSIEKDTINTVSVNRDDNGGYKASQAEKEVHRELKGFSGKIDSSLYASARAKGVPDGVILDLIKMYSYNVDFQRDIHDGDKFDVMYEEYVTEAGDVVPGKGNIVYARLTLDDRDMPFYRYTSRSGDTDYFDAKGQSAKKSLMKTPIDGARLSSGFGMRKHPVLGFSKMHKGIDFAAPRGTPIYAAGDGTIEKMGPFSSYGNYVKIRHRAGLETAYAHMSGFKSGLRAGSRIKQGQIIGYVGTTGRSTGPHLHYEIMINGSQVNPLGVKMASGNGLAGKELSSFKALVGTRARQFQTTKNGTPIALKDEKVKTASK